MSIRTRLNEVEKDIVKQRLMAKKSYLEDPEYTDGDLKGVLDTIPITLNTFQELSKDLANYPDLDIHNDLLLAVGLAEEVGEVLSHVKKITRNDNGAITEVRRVKMLAEFSDVLFYFSRLSQHYGFTLEEIANANQIKLLGRTKNGKPKG